MAVGTLTQLLENWCPTIQHGLHKRDSILLQPEISGNPGLKAWHNSNVEHRVGPLRTWAVTAPRISLGAVACQKVTTSTVVSQCELRLTSGNSTEP